MSYIEANLAKDEKIIASIKHSWAGTVGLIIQLVICCVLGGVLFRLIPMLKGIEAVAEVADELELDIWGTIIADFLGAVMILISSIIFIAGIVEMKCAQLIVTNKRLLGRRGFISKKTTDIILSSLDTIAAGNSFFGGLLHFGYIEVASPASMVATAYQTGTTRYNYISNTMEFRKAVLAAIDNAKEEERKAQAEEQAKAMREAMKSND